MKKKLKTVFLLIVLSLAGIIIFQGYWTFNAYRVNKQKFDSNIDTIMQRAIEDCKKDYFDSIRVVLLKHLSPKVMTIIVDTIPGKDTVNSEYNIWFLSKNMPLPNGFNPKDYRVVHVTEPGYGPKISKPRINAHSTKLGAKSDYNMTFKLNTAKSSPKPPANDSSILFFAFTPYHTSKSQLNLYRKKINHKASLAEVLTEMSFYEPELIHGQLNSFLMDDYFNYFRKIITKSFKSQHDDSLIVHNVKAYYAAVTKRYIRSDSVNLSYHLKKELDREKIRADFKVKFSPESTPPGKPNLHYSETNEYSYKYHGDAPFNDNGIKFFVRATCSNSQYAVLKSMLITLLLSLLLIMLTIYCFLFVTRTILEQKKLADLKDDFINNMTHELKTPIATITVAIEGLQKFNALNDPEKTKRYLQTSREELNRLNQLVSKVLNVATFENKQIILAKEVINVDELLTEIIASEKSKTNKTVNISYANKDNVETIIADRFHFRNVLVNLVDNAIKYSGEPADITITLIKSGNNVLFSVKDNGIGIPPEHISQVFDKFHRVPTGNIHNVKGTGLGLSYVKYIVEAHGGSVSVKSQINTGSEFIVTLPLTNI